MADDLPDDGPDLPDERDGFAELDDPDGLLDPHRPTTGGRVAHTGLPGVPAGAELLDDDLGDLDDPVDVPVANGSHAPAAHDVHAGGARAGEAVR